MKLCNFVLSVIFVIFLDCHQTTSQVPPRLAIPGAVLLPQQKQYRPQRIQSEPPNGLRLRRPIQNALPLPPAPIRPVVEEVEESATGSSNFDDEVSRLGLNALQTAVRQAGTADDNEQPRPLQFRPERPLPVLRSDVRESSSPVPRPIPVLRQDVSHQRPQRPLPVRAEQGFGDDQAPLPVQRSQQPVRTRQQIPREQQQPIRQQARPAAPIASRQYGDEDESRTRKPNVQILKKYRNDNPDGSITWGYENEDGTFKEETLGIDCITRGRYGYVDPDGVRRDYKYETGHKCDEPEEEELLPEARPVQPQARKPLSQQQPQFRPSPTQF